MVHSSIQSKVQPMHKYICVICGHGGLLIWNLLIVHPRPTLTELAGPEIII